MPEERRPLNDYAMGPFVIADVDTASQSNALPAPYSGQVIGIKCSVTAATTGATASGLTVRKNGTDMSGFELAVPASDALDAYSASFSPNDTDGYIEENDTIDIDTDGLGDTGGEASVYLIVRR